MSEISISLIISIIALVIAIISYFQSKSKTAAPAEEFFNTKPLQLQAYERLVMLTERIALPNLISRLSQPHLSAQEMQLVLLENTKQEYEYNTSQQIYVSSIAWESLRNLKDQNMMTINQVAGLLPPDARAHDLNKKILEVLLEQDKVLHNVVLDVLNTEAKKIMK